MCLFLFLSLTLLAATVQSHPPLVIGFCLWRFMADYGVFFPHTLAQIMQIFLHVYYYGLGMGGQSTTYRRGQCPLNHEILDLCSQYIVVQKYNPKNRNSDSCESNQIL